MTIKLPRHLILVLALVLSACTTSAPVQRFPEMTFRNLPPIRLDVGRIEVVSEFRPAAQAPHIEYDMPIAPENAIRRWVQDRLQPVGREGTIRVVIRNAEATSTPLKTDDSFKGYFKKEQAARIEMAVDVAVQWLDERQFVKAEASGRSARSRTTLEGTTLNERDKILYDMVEDLMKGYNGEIEPSIRASFGPIIVL